MRDITDTHEPGCYTCDADLGSAPREHVVDADGWRAACCFNTTLPGWLVLVPRRHVFSFAELTPAEAAAMGPLVRRLSIALAEVTGCAKTYAMQFSEADGYAHLHVHLVPRMPDQPADRRGPACFGYLSDDPSAWASEAERDDLARRIRAAYEQVAA